MDEFPPVDHTKEQNLKLLGDYTPVPDEELEKLLGSTFMSNMRQVSALPDTFGLCGVAALDAAGKLTMPDKWKNITYDAKELKEKYDKRRTTGERLTAIEIFELEHSDKLMEGFYDVANYKAITKIYE